MADVDDLPEAITVSDLIKVPKRDREEAMSILDNIDGVTVEQRTTDEFDIPPTAVLRVDVDLGAIDD